MTETKSRRPVLEVAGIVGIAGLIISILSLSVQVAENTKSVQLASMDTILDRYNEIRMALATNKEFASLVERGTENMGALTPLETYRFQAYMAQLFYSGNAHYTRTREVAPGTGLWCGSEAFFRDLVRHHAGAQTWWEHNKAYLSPGFRSTLDAPVRSAECRH